MSVMEGLSLFRENIIFSSVNVRIVGGWMNVRARAMAVA
jgi:hypothetical protein